MAVLLLVLQTSQNEVVYSAWTNKLSDRFMSNVVVSGMKLSLSQPVSPGRSANPASAAVAAWYATHSNVRRLWAIRDAHRLRVLVTLEPTLDGNDTDPAWIANRHAWAHELQLCTDQSVRLERLDEPMFDGAAIDADSLIVATLSWRDPSFT